MPNGALGSLQQQSLSLFAPVQSSPESAAFSRRFLKSYESGVPFQHEAEMLGKMRGQARTSREKLQAARDRINNQKRSNAEMAFGLAAAFGAPTRTGGFGETMGRVGGALQQEMVTRRELEKEKQKDILGLESQIMGIDEGLMQSEYGLAKLKSQREASMAEEALKTLARSKAGAGLKMSSSERSLLKRGEYLDKAYAPVFLERSGEEVQEAKDIGDLTEAITILEHGGDIISGPIVGAMPDWLRQVFVPKSMEAQKKVEAVAQKNLRKILGGQFTEREGMMLLKRTYDPLAEEEVNRRNTVRLMKTIQYAQENENRKAEYYSKGHTLTGYTDGPQYYDVTDFLDPEKDLVVVRKGDETFLKIKGESQRDAYNRWKRRKKALGDKATQRQMPDEFFISEETPIGMARGGAVNMQIGGPAVEEWSDLPADVSGIENLDYINEPLIGGGLGVTAGFTGAALMDLKRKMSQRAILEPGEMNIQEALIAGDRDPQSSLLALSERMRAGKPGDILTEGGEATKQLALHTLPFATEPGAALIEEAGEIAEKQPAVIRKKISEGLGAKPYFTLGDDLKEELFSNAKPMYEAAYAAHENITDPEVLEGLDKILDTEVGKKVSKEAIENINLDTGIPIDELKQFEEIPSLEYLDEVKKALDDQIAGSRVDNKDTNRTRKLKNMKRKLVASLDEISPDYAEARAQYAGDLEMIQALEKGRDEFLSKHPDEIAREMAGMSVAEKGALRSGVAHRVMSDIQDAANQDLAVRKIIDTEKFDSRISQLFDSDIQYQIFKEALEAESRILKSAKEMSTLGEKARVKGKMDTRGIFQKILKAPIIGSPYSPTGMMLRIFTKMPEMTEQQANAVINKLRTSNADELVEMAERMNRRKASVTQLKGKLPRYGKAAAAGLLGGVAAGTALDILGN